MSWQDGLPRQGSEPETRLWRILDSMSLRYERNVPVSTPFRDYPVEADVIVEDVLVIEVQSRLFHTKSRRERKDEAKRECFEAMGYGVLWIWDKELEWAYQKARGEKWTGALKEWIKAGLDYAKKVREAYIQFVSVRQNTPAVIHPDYRMMNIREDHRP